MLPELKISEGNEELILEELLEEFNKIDKSKEGHIKLSAALKMLREVNHIHLRKDDPIIKGIIFQKHGMTTFDQYLSLLHQAEICIGSSKNHHTNTRLLEFISLLEDYIKKCEQSGIYLEARKAYQKVAQIREKEMQRCRNQMLRKQQSKVEGLNHLQQKKLTEFRTAWEQYQDKYEETAMNSIEKLKAKHFRELQLEEQRTRSYYESYLKPSKRVIDLQAKERHLVKYKEYQEAERVKELRLKLEERERNSKESEIIERIARRKQLLQKHQEAALLGHLKRIEKERNQQVHRQKVDSHLMLSRLKSIENQVIQKQSMQIKEKLDELRHTICLKRKKSRSFQHIRENPQAGVRQKKALKIRINSVQRTMINPSDLYSPV